MTDLFGELVRSNEETVPRTLSSGHNANARVRNLNDRIALVAAGSSDRIFVGRVPSDAVLLPESTIYYDAMGGTTSFDFGDANDTDRLVDGEVTTSAGSVSANAARPIEQTGDPLWKQLAYATDPQKYIDLYITPAGSDMTGDLAWSLYFTS